MRSESTKTPRGTSSRSHSLLGLALSLVLGSSCQPEPKAARTSMTSEDVPTKHRETSPAQPPMVEARPPITPVIIGHAEWGAAPEQQGCRTQSLERVSIHHTASIAPDDGEGRSRAKGFQRYHQQQGWMDIAYHLIVTREGEVLEGRRTDCAGDTFTGYDPTGHLLIVLDGNFEEQDPSAAQIERTVELLAWAHEHHGIDLATLSGHRDLAATLCPGASVYALIENGALASKVANRLQPHARTR